MKPESRPPEIWMQTGTGQVLDMMDPRPETIDLSDVAEALARIPRFTGHVRSGAYSVAQHLCLGTDAILAETGRLELAQAFHLHDAHEFAVGDIGTPTAQALDARVGEILADSLKGLIKLLDSDRGRLACLGAMISQHAREALKAGFDRAIYAAVDHPWPLPPDIAAEVRHWDLRMLATERAHLLTTSPHPWHPSVEAAQPVRMRGSITPWPWPRAADEWTRRLHTLFPHLAARAA